MTSARAQRVQARGAGSVAAPARPSTSRGPAASRAARRCGSPTCWPSLQIEFPAVTTSKLRFLEEQGLVEPVRTAAGYRQYSPADIERLRFVLRQQRDRYMPLKVIGDRLAALDAGEEDEPAPRARLATRDGVREVAGTRLDDRRARARVRRRGGLRRRARHRGRAARGPRPGRSTCGPGRSSSRPRRWPSTASTRVTCGSSARRPTGRRTWSSRSSRRGAVSAARRRGRARARWRPRWASCARRCTPRSCARRSPTSTP